MAELCAHSGKQFSGAEGFNEIVICTGVEGSHFLSLQSARGKNNDGNV